MATSTEGTEYLPEYKLNELCQIIPEYDGDSVLLNTFISSCDAAFQVATEEQKYLLTVHLKNKLRGRASQLINSRELRSWIEIRELLRTHFGDSRDLTSLIYALQQIKQGDNENPQNFVHRINAHNSKLHASINQQNNLSPQEKNSQQSLIDKMSLNTLLTGLEPKLGAIIRAGNPKNMIEAAERIRKEYQLSFLEKQSHKSNTNRNPTPSNKNHKTCNYCKKPGHVISECRSKQYNDRNRPSTSNFNNFRNNNYQRTDSSQNFHRPYNPNNNNPPRNQNNNFQRNFRPNQGNSNQNQSHHLNSQIAGEVIGTSVVNSKTNQIPLQIEEISNQVQTMHM